METDIQEDLRTIYTALGWKYLGTTPNWLCKSNSPEYGKPVHVGLNPEGHNDRWPTNPLADTDDSRAEFARLLVWAIAEGYTVSFYFCTATVSRIEWDFKIEMTDADYPRTMSPLLPQRAFIRALAAALRARGEE